ncbi:MAG: bifunctional diaminohydroxyphosphoribosylaminopyrimidine deaminase/5-amino-6-(5-phosphoribosylamino)uracil reductase RibD [Proteobacteria bacterium]|nr:bifunctional diaminohydroxyphosphoribosylaminopyrimidine deaminase/5-amino-6-(5-phosphoribosylamino)uracil reductase RibD [Pseudomonadota bacterium]
MRAALALARRGLGRTWPNPTVGCVIVRDGAVVGRGWTQPGGRPHAETEALARAGAAARGATAYVSLEPCSHHGQTAPCADALIAAGVARVVGALEDPDKRVGGRGYAKLEAAGIAVTRALLADDAAALNAGFLLRVRDGRPLVTLKVASSLDGRIASHSGASRWITGEPARARGHLLRAQHDAVLVGSRTALLDDPELTCRLPGLTAASPARIVADGHLRLPLTSRLVRSARTAPTWILVLPTTDASRRQAFQECGIELIEVPADDGGNLDLGAALGRLGGRGLTRLLVEGGGRLAAALLRAGLVDRVAWFRAPSVIGGDGVPAAAAFGIDRPDAAPRFVRDDALELGDDRLETYRVQR